MFRPSLPLRALALLCLALVSLACAADGDRTIQIDPRTGEVVEDGADADAGEDARAWTTDEGVQMLTPGRDDAPVTEAVECPDGSLRIGHPAGDAGAEGREALCAEPRGR